MNSTCPIPRRAFTLVEAIAAIIILAVAVPPMMIAVRDSAVSRADPIMQSRARWLVTERLEDIIADRHSTTRGYTYVTSTNYPSEPSIIGFPGFSRSVSIAETGASLSGAGTGYKTVTITVSWMSPKAGARSLAVSTVITDYTP